MKKTVLPENIKNMIGTQEYTIDSIGESGSEVRVYDNYVLKKQPHSRETDNEAAMICLRVRIHLSSFAGN